MTESEIFNFAVKNYNNYVCKTSEEFSDDYNTVTKIKKILNKYDIGEEINFRLLLNHFTTFYNVFTPSAATIIMFNRLPKSHHSVIKTVATFLNYLPNNLEEYDVYIDDVPFDKNFIEFLRSI